MRHPERRPASEWELKARLQARAACGAESCRPCSVARAFGLRRLERLQTARSRHSDERPIKVVPIQRMMEMYGLLRPASGKRYIDESGSRSTAAGDLGVTGLQRRLSVPRGPSAPAVSAGQHESSNTDEVFAPIQATI